MAERAILSLVQRVGSIDSKLKPEVESLCRELALMIPYLKEADAKHHNSDLEKVWLKQLRELVFEAEDAVDFFVDKAAKKRLDGVVLKTTNLAKLFSNTHQLRKKIRDIQGNLKMLLEHRKVRSFEEAQTSAEANRLEASGGRNFLPVDVDVVGFESEEEELMTLLVQADRPFVVISITGIGGLGKSTLAKKFYHGEFATKHFICRAFVCISTKYEMRDVLIEIIEQVSQVSFKEKQELESVGTGNLKKMLFHLLEGKSCLVVLDDVRRTEDWDNLKGIFPVPHYGDRYRVLLTTRDERIARYADPTPSYNLRLQPLDELNSLILFSMVFFRLGYESGATAKERLYHLNKQMNDLPMQIVRKCHGLPLAILALGALLLQRNPTTVAEWKKMFDTTNTHLAQVLYSSYIELPDHLKPCFLYLGVFPEDYCIQSDRLIRLWAAEGFLKLGGYLLMEDVGGEFLMELIQRNLIQVAEWKSNGLPESVKIHNVLLNLAISVANEGNFLNISSTHNYLKGYRRAALHNEEGEALYSSSSYRKEVAEAPYPSSSYDKEVAAPYPSSSYDKEVALYPSSSYDKEIAAPYSSSSYKEGAALYSSSSSSSSSSKASSYKEGTVLYPSSSNASSYKEGAAPYPSSSSSILLRSLVCFGEMSPSFCGHFKLLNVLDLEGASGIENLPKEIGKLIFLKYLSLCGTGLKTLPPSVGDLYNLQTLNLYKTRIESVPIEIFKLDKLRHLLCFNSESRNTSDHFIVESAIRVGRRPSRRRIHRLRDLQTLWFHTGSWIDGGLETLINLRELGLTGFEGLMEKFSEALCRSLVKLKRLEVLYLEEQASLGHGAVILHSFSSHVYLYDITIIGAIQKLPDLNNFPPNLTRLRLGSIHLKKDMMVILEKLPHLKDLTLDRQSYDGVVMKCSAGGFPKLENLTLIWFEWLILWIVEKGAMRNLRTLEMNSLFGLKWIPEGLKHMTTLQKLSLSMPRAFLEKFKEGGEDSFFREKVKEGGEDSFFREKAKESGGDRVKFKHELSIDIREIQIPAEISQHLSEIERSFLAGIIKEHQVDLA